MSINHYRTHNPCNHCDFLDTTIYIEKHMMIGEGLKKNQIFDPSQTGRGGGDGGRRVGGYNP